MRLLLDTHIALWAIADAPNLSDKARALIDDPGNEVFVSVVSVWEIAIKHALIRPGGAAIPIPGRDALSYFRLAEYDILDVSAAHVLALEALPPLHADPFDRLLVAQALSMPLRLLTHDRMVAAYSDSIIEV